MRKRIIGEVVTLRAIAGLHVTTLAWDLPDDGWRKRADLLGFAVGRAKVNADGSVVDRHWLRGIKRFRGVEAELPPGTPVSTGRHPVQTFQ